MYLDSYHWQIVILQNEDYVLPERLPIAIRFGVHSYKNSRGIVLPVGTRADSVAPYRVDIVKGTARLD